MKSKPEGGREGGRERGREGENEKKITGRPLFNLVMREEGGREGYVPPTCVLFFSSSIVVKMSFVFSAMCCTPGPWFCSRYVWI